MSQKNNSLGGISFWLTATTATRTTAPTSTRTRAGSGHVAAGTRVGTVGTTGNAAGGPPHLHFEIHPGGGGAVNPYPTLSKYC